MLRDPNALDGRRFDLAVIGGGAVGAWTAWLAARAGHSVALLEAADFGGGTSANSLKVIHGGLRYLQNASFARMRGSIRERSELVRSAPGLVEPLPFVVGTYAARRTGRAAFRVGMAVADLVGWDRNRGLPPHKRFPRGRVLSVQETLRLFPHFDPRGLTGGACWFDAQVVDSERLPIALVCDAWTRGARVLNYCPVEQVHPGERGECSVVAKDESSGRRLELRARVVIFAAGAGNAELLRASGFHLPVASPPQALAWNLVLGRRLVEVGVGVRAWPDPDTDPVGGGNRFLFLVPWENRTLIGTGYRPLTDGLDPAPDADRMIAELLGECDRAVPGLRVHDEEVVGLHLGLLPMDRGATPRLQDQDRVDEVASAPGDAAVLVLTATKYTTARRLAGRAVVLAGRRLGSTAPADSQLEARLPDDRAAPSRLRFPLPDATAIESEVARFVNDEMAVHLEDVIFRRTNLGGTMPLERDRLAPIARAMGDLLGWSEDRRAEEIERALGVTHSARRSPSLVSLDE